VLPAIRQIQPYEVSALNMMLPAFAAECRRLLHGARMLLSADISDPHDADSSMHAGRRRCCRSTGQTDGQTDGLPTVT